MCQLIRTVIQEQDFENIDTEDLIVEEDVVITVSHQGYIKRVPKDSYKNQKRGGKGKKAMGTRDEDFLEQVFAATTRCTILFFTSTPIQSEINSISLLEDCGEIIEQKRVPISKNEKIIEGFYTT